LTSLHKAAARSASSTFSSISWRVAHAAHAQAVGDVLVDRLGKRVRLLEDHRDAHAHLDRIDVPVDDVHAVGIEQDLAFVAHVRVEVVHAVEAAQEGRFAAARRADQRGDLVLLDRKVDVLQGLEVAIVEAERIDLRLEFGAGGFVGGGAEVLTMVILVGEPWGSPFDFLAEVVADPDGDCIHRQRHHHQHQVRRRRRWPERPPRGARSS
jgi:hypothetical protein